MRLQRRRGSFIIWVSIFFILASVALTMVQLIRYSRVRAQLPEGLIIAEVPVGGLNRQEASERLLEIYTLPVEITYGENRIQLDPSVIGFELDLDTMMAAADLQRTDVPFWEGFWDFLWARQPRPNPIPLDWDYSEERLRLYLQSEISIRYNQPALSSRPAVGTKNFIPGAEGIELDIESAILPIENALRSIQSRTVNLPLQRTAPGRLAFQNLEVFLKQTIDQSGFDGLVGMYVLDLQTAQEIHFAYQQGVELPAEPDIAFTAASIIKIPIMLTVFKNVDNPDSETLRLLSEMIELSGNDPADWVLQRVVDPTLGPLAVTDDMEDVGLNSTFLAGHFYLGAPLLFGKETPGNTRQDIDTDPDVFNQTTPSDMGMLLADLYQCATRGGGTLIAVFPGEITQQECQAMITFLTQNRLGSLIEGGVPDGTQVAHKHGWVTNLSGVINTIGDAGIVYSPAGNYVVVVFLYDPIQLIWDPASTLVGDLSEVIYNYYNQQ